MYDQEKLKEKYEVVCPDCGRHGSFKPSLYMQSGVNKGTYTCSCGMEFNVSITDDNNSVRLKYK